MSGILAKWYGSQRVDAVLSPYDGISRGVLSALKSRGYGSDAKPLPIITGQDAELASVKSIIAGQQSQTVYKDIRLLAQAATTMVDDILNGRSPWVDDTRSYKNGVKAVPALPAAAHERRQDQLRQRLVAGGYYTDAELK